MAAAADVVEAEAAAVAAAVAASPLGGLQYFPTALIRDQLPVGLDELGGVPTTGEDCRSDAGCEDQEVRGGDAAHGEGVRDERAQAQDQGAVRRWSRGLPRGRIEGSPCELGSQGDFGEVRGHTR